MRILLVDVDSVIPNLALMKLAAFYKNLGCIVVLVKLSRKVYRDNKPSVVDCSGFDHIWVSAIFDNTIEGITFKNIGDFKNITFGGTGVDITSKLPDEIYRCNPDYSIYPETDTGYAFISRGCSRNCGFCIVPEKEGYTKQEAPSIRALITHKKMKFLDNNFLSLANHKVLLKELVGLKIKCQFNQGLDIRLIDDENSKLISELNYIGERIFAFDHIEDKKQIENGLAIVKKYIQQPWRIKFFIYCHPDMDIISDVYARILWCKENKVLPYFMRDLSCWKSENVRTYNDFSAWCNQPGVFKTHTYEQFCKKRRPQEGRTDVLPSWYRV